MNEKLFELKDIAPQLNKKQIKEIEHLIYMARETEDMQAFQIGEFSRKIVVMPSGKMCFQEERQICAATECDHTAEEGWNVCPEHNLLKNRSG